MTHEFPLVRQCDVRVLLLLFLSGCAASIPVKHSLVGGTLSWTKGAKPKFDGQPCKATRRIDVIDAGGAPIAGAQIIARCRVHAGSNGGDTSIELYEAAAVATDSNGSAHICDPSTLWNPDPSWVGMGGGYASGDPGSLTVEVNGTVIELKGPFATDPITVRFAP